MDYRVPIWAELTRKMLLVICGAAGAARKKTFPRLQRLCLRQCHGFYVSLLIAINKQPYTSDLSIEVL
jgi:hypothetical protein